VTSPAGTSFFNRFYRAMIIPGLLLFVLTGYVALTSPHQPEATDVGYPLWVRIAGAFIVGPTSIILGWFVARRVKDNFIGPILIHWGCATNAELGVAYLPAFWGALSLYYLMIVISPGLILLLASFPTGRGVTPGWDRLIKGAALALMGLGVLANISNPTAYGLTSPSPLAIPSLIPIFPMVFTTYGYLSPPALLVAAGLIIYRYRITHEAERKQMRWLSVLGVYILLMSIVTSTLDFAAWSELEKFVFSVLGLVAFALPSVVISNAILRHHLWDIDVLIRRTLVYSLLTGLLALTYFGLVVILQGAVTALGGTRSEWVTVASTLAVAALVAPLRSRVQAFIDRRFFRRKYNAAQTLAGFAAAARDETDLGALTTRLVRTVQETFEPESASVWLRDQVNKPSAGSFGEESP
jgi:hypothetical protein